MPEISASKYLVNAGWSDVPHLDEKTKAQLLAETEPHLRDARTKGIPSLGAGAIYPVSEDQITCNPFQIPRHWPRCYGLDVGWNRTAAIWLAVDRSVDCVYAYTEHYRSKAEPSIHVAAIKARGEWIPGAIDPASLGSSQIDGKTLIEIYRGLGLSLTSADNTLQGPEGGIHAVWERLSTGRLKIFKTCQNTLNEYRYYRRDEKGKIVKANDHCLHPDTVVITRAGRVRIADLVGTEGEVLTVGGEWAPYRNCRKTASDQPVVEVIFEDGSTVICTPDHRFLTPGGWVEAADMPGLFGYDAVSQRIGHKSCASRSYRRPSRSSGGGATTSVASIFSVMATAFIAWCGRLPTVARFLMASMSIMTMRTAPTISPATSSCCPAASMSAYIRLESAGRHQHWRTSARQSGTDPMKAESGIASIMTAIGRRFTVAATSFVGSAEPNIRGSGTGSAPTPASRHGAARLARTMLSASARLAARLIGSTATPRARHAAGNAVLRCVGVRPAGRSDVYCLTVPSTQAFAVESGIIVHNCMDALRYGIMTGIKIAVVEPAQTIGVDFGRGDRTVGY
jgi:hypothetical protein